MKKAIYGFAALGQACRGVFDGLSRYIEGGRLDVADNCILSRPVTGMTENPAIFDRRKEGEDVPGVIYLYPASRLSWGMGWPFGLPGGEEEMVYLVPLVPDGVGDALAAGGIFPAGPPGPDFHL